MPEWLFEGLASEAVRGLILLGGTAMLAFLKRRSAKWAGPALYGLGAFAAIAVGMIAMRGHSYLDRDPRITPDNAEAAIRKWADTFGYGIKRTTEAGAHFSFEIGLPGGQPVGVRRPKNLSHYLVVFGSLSLGDKDSGFLMNFPANQVEELTTDLKIEMLRSGIEYSLHGSPHIERILVEKHVPIADKLTEYDFVLALHEVNVARSLAAQTLARKLRLMRTSE